MHETLRIDMKEDRITRRNDSCLIIHEGIKDTKIVVVTATKAIGRITFFINKM